MLSDADKKRFFSRVRQAGGDGCWLWTGTNDGHGKGRFIIKGHRHSVRRVAYSLYYGSVPDGQILFARCGQQLCVRPDHLFAGTLFDRPPCKVVEAPIVRFLRFVDKTAPNGCWNWTGGRTHAYGCFEIDGRSERAHRFAYQNFNGTIPKGKCVLHRCDNPTCVNPEHLFLGTRTDNANDKVAKDRQARGEMYSHAVLTEDLVHQARALHIPGEYGCNRIARDLGVTAAAVNALLRGKTWKHIKEAA